MLPDEFQTALGFDAVAGWVRASNGIVWLFSASGLAADGIVAAVNQARKWHAERIRAKEEEEKARRDEAERAEAAAARAQAVEALVEGIGELSDDEFDWVMTAVRDRQPTIYPMLSSPVAHALVDKEYLTSGSSGTVLGYPFHFVSDVWDALMESQSRILSEYAEWSSRKRPVMITEVGTTWANPLRRSAKRLRSRRISTTGTLLTSRRSLVQSQPRPPPHPIIFLCPDPVDERGRQGPRRAVPQSK